MGPEGAPAQRQGVWWVLCVGPSCSCPVSGAAVTTYAQPEDSPGSLGQREVPPEELPVCVCVRV